MAVQPALFSPLPRLTEERQEQVQRRPALQRKTCSLSSESPSRLVLLLLLSLFFFLLFSFRQENERRRRVFFLFSRSEETGIYLVLITAGKEERGRTQTMEKRQH